MSTNAVPIPLSDPIARPSRPDFKGRKDPLEGQVTQPWVDYFTDRGLFFTSVPVRIDNVALTDQAASIAAVDMAGVPLSAGLYRLTYYTRITLASGAGHSLTITLDWSEGGVSPSYSGVAIVGDTTTTIQSDSIMILISAASPVRYSTTYVPVGAPGTYSLYVVLEKVLA